MAGRRRRRRSGSDLPGGAVVVGGADRADRRGHQRLPLRRRRRWASPVPATRCPRRRPSWSPAAGRSPTCRSASGSGVRTGEQAARDRRVRRRGDRRVGVRQCRRARRAGRRRANWPPSWPTASGAAATSGRPGMTQLPGGIPSPPQGVWYVGPIALRAYAIFIIIGIVVAVWWGNKRFVARGGRPGRVTDISVFAVPVRHHRRPDLPRHHRQPAVLRRGPQPVERASPSGTAASASGAPSPSARSAPGSAAGTTRCRWPPYADSVAPGLVVAQAIGRLGNYFNQELFGAPTTVPWGLEVFVRTPGGVAGAVPADGELRVPDRVRQGRARGALRRLPADLPVRAALEPAASPLVVVWADKRFQLGGGRAFAVYVAGYTLGRAWIEMLRIDPANHIFGLRINVYVPRRVRRRRDLPDRPAERRTGGPGAGARSGAAGRGRRPRGGARSRAGAGGRVDPRPARAAGRRAVGPHGRDRRDGRGSPTAPATREAPADRAAT